MIEVKSLRNILALCLLEPVLCFRLVPFPRGQWWRLKLQVLLAGLDLYEHEPMMAPELVELENVIILHHLGSATEEARSAMAAIAARSVSDVISGKTPEHILNPEILEKD